MKRYFYTLLHLFHPAGMEPLRFIHAHSISSVQPYYDAGDSTAKENVQMNKKLVLTILIVLTTLTLAACAPRASTILPPEEGAAFASDVDEIVENMLIGFSQNDYTTLARDWDPDWRETYDESAFHQDYEAIIAPYGAYQSKTLDHVEDRPGFSARRIVFYRVVFENAPDVTVLVYFKPKDPDHQILGLGWAEE